MYEFENQLGCQQKEAAIAAEALCLEQDGKQPTLLLFPAFPIKADTPSNGKQAEGAGVALYNGQTSLTTRKGPRKPANKKRRKPRGKVYDPNLGRHPIPAITVRHTPLMEAVVEEENILEAVRKVNAEPYKAVGVDRKTVRETCKPLLEDPVERRTLVMRLLKGYTPEVVRITQIPKKSGGMRKLGIATVLDRIVQTMLWQVVDALIPEGTWSCSSFAYQHGKGVAEAIAEAGRLIERGYGYAVSLDLRAFFDNVPHHRLEMKLRKHLPDWWARQLAWRFVTATVRYNGKESVNRRGIPQGSVIAPWLASMLYLDELDRELELRGHAFVRYADDCTIFCRSKEAAKRVKKGIIRFIEGTMECPVNKDKTKVVPSETLVMLGLHRRNSRWMLDRNKEKEACGGFLSTLRTLNTKEEPVASLENAVQRFTGFLNHYRRIPDLATSKVPALERWMVRKLTEVSRNEEENLYVRMTASKAIKWLRDEETRRAQKPTESERKE